MFTAVFVLLMSFTFVCQAEEPADYYVERRSYGTKRDTEPPSYVKENYWLDYGLDSRFRYEYRDNDYRRAINTIDQPLLWRTRAYLGVKQLLDPFRFALEFEDSRRNNNQFAPDNRDVNEFEILQAYGELYFENALSANRPIRLQAGRMAFEYLDRRLIANNEWRNTTNNFQGYRLVMGRQENDWQLDLLAVQPVNRLLYEPDQPNSDQWFYGAIGNWRRWSDVITFQPYYLNLKQRAAGANVERDIQAAALRGYGTIGRSHFDYDFDLVYQFGRNRSRYLAILNVNST